MILISLPDAKSFHPCLTIGRRYDARPFGANGSVIRCDDGETDIILLTERLQSMNATMWFRWNTADNGFWDFNHLEGGYDPDRTRPTSKIPEHDRIWKGGKWAAQPAVLKDGKLTPVGPKPLNVNFEFVTSARIEKQRDGSTKEIARLSVKYKGEGLAIFEGENLEQRAREYIRTHGYLAEWVFQKYQTGSYVNWTEALRVHP